MAEEIFFQLAIILLIAFLVSYIARIFKQPLILGYIIAGIIVSPFLIKFGATSDLIESFSRIGIAFLLFIVGLHLNPKIIREIGFQSFLIAFGQMILTFGLGFIVAYKLLFLGLNNSLYIAIALTFSSTIIVLKLLSDKKQLDTLYGKLSIGILIVQDLFAVGVLILLSSFGENVNFVSVAFKTFLIGGGLILALFLFGYFLLSRITRTIAKSQELLFLFSICWCFLVAALFAFAGFSLEIGALIAGVILSISPYSTEISSKIRPIRDFFLIIFFIILGLNLNITQIGGVFVNALIFSGIVLIFKPLFLMVFMALLGYTKKTNFMVGTTLSQISEFSLIVLLLGISLGHISNEILSTITLTLIITILGSTYLTIYSKKIYSSFPRLMSIFENKKIKKNVKRFKRNYNAILFGYNRTGFDILRSFNKLKKSYLVVDFDPDTIESLSNFKIPCLYGDVDDPELLEELNLNKIDLAVSTIPDYESNFFVLESIRLVNPDAIIIVRATDVDEALELYKKGANYVLTPSFLSGEHVGKMVKEIKTNKKGYEREKNKHIKRLNELRKKSKGSFRSSFFSNGKFHY